MNTQKQTKAVGYVRVATVGEHGKAPQIQRHKDTLIAHCKDSRILLAHMIVDIAIREGRERAFELLETGQARVLVVPSLAQLSRSVSELAGIIERYFAASSPVADLIAVAEGIDTRTPEGRMALNVLRTVARFEMEDVCHA